MIDERKIIIGLITSTDYLRQIRPIWDPKLLESSTAKRIAGWIWPYFDKYDKAPGRDIEDIFYAKVKANKLPKDLAEEIEEDILPSLSKEYENDNLNLKFLVEETKSYFTVRSLALLTEDIQTLIKNGELEKAEDRVHTFKALGGSTADLNAFILSVTQIRRIKRKPPTLLMKPWLRAGQTTIIYGQYGSGKSLLAQTVAYLLGMEEYDSPEAEIGEWQIKKPTGCLYVDGELGQQEMEERFSKMEWIGRQNQEHRVKILSVPEYQLATEDSFYLSNRANQLKITHWLKQHPEYKLIVLDSASTLFGLVEENDNSEWNTKINPFLRDLRALNVACLLLHHAGKDNKRGLRGASAIGAMAHYIFKLSNHPNKNIDDGEAWFIISKDKQRAGGYSFKTFALKYTQTEDEQETHWKLTSVGENIRD